jgi:light-regulated signal transduction histidine kinase (bacteriophytochrome)
MYDENNKIYSILVFGYEVTDQVTAKNNNLKNQHLIAAELELKVQQRTKELSESGLRLVDKNAELEKMNVELQSFAYVTSHDLQEPLRKIQTFAARILERDNETLSAKGKDDFKRMRASAGHMRQLLDDLLSFSRLTSIEEAFENCYLGKITGEVITELNDIIKKKNATVEIGTMCAVPVIPFQFHQLMHILVSNALKFSKLNSRLHIIIQCSIIKANKLNVENTAIPSVILSPEKEYCHISVSDDGIGFEPEYNKLIFGLFQKLHNKDEYEGTGIGLAIVKKIVENHNGFISATGVLDKGAMFDIYLPVGLAP